MSQLLCCTSHLLVSAASSALWLVANHQHSHVPGTSTRPSSPVSIHYKHYSTPLKTKEVLAFGQISHTGYCPLPQILCSKAVLRKAAYNLLLCETHSNYISSLPLKKAWLLRSPTAQSCESQMMILIVCNGPFSSAHNDCPLGLHPLPSPLPSPGGPRSKSLLCLFLQRPLPLRFLCFPY